MGEHHIPRKLGDIPGHLATEIAPPKFVHVSKELHMEPVFKNVLDDKGKHVQVITGYEFRLYRGDGVTFKRSTKKLQKYSKRLKSNDWGAEPYKLHRERSDAAYQVRLAQMAAAAELV